jgi:hypothetical protein
MVRCARYVFHARQCRPHWHSKSCRVIVAGDAAHLTPPMRGQGMSSGVADADNLAWKLWAVVRGFAPTKVVESFNAEREHRVVANTHIAVWLSQLIGSRWSAFCRVRDWVMPALLLNPVVRPMLDRDVFIAQTRFAAWLQGPSCDACDLVGTLPPLGHDTAAALGGAAFALLTQRDELVAHLALESAPQWTVLLQGRVVCAPQLPAKVLLLRPDGYVFAAWNQRVPITMLSELMACLAQPRTERSLLHRGSGVLFAALRYISPPIVIFLLASGFLLIVLLGLAWLTRLLLS